MKDIKAVVYSGNRTVYPDMVTSAKSLLMHNKIDKVYFLIEDDVFPYEIPEIIETINMRNQKWFPDGGANTKSRFSYLVLMRAVLPYIFPDLDKILSLDMDTIILGDITPLWGMDIEKNYMAAVEEPTSAMGEKNHKETMFYVHQNEYFNTGVAFMNLKKQRDGFTNKNIDLLNKRTFYSVEQDTFNLLCEGKILKLPSDYNATRDWTAPTDNPLIYHYAGIPLEKWRREPLVKYFEKKSWAGVMEANRGL